LLVSQSGWRFLFALFGAPIHHDGTYEQ